MGERKGGREKRSSLLEANLPDERYVKDGKVEPRKTQEQNWGILYQKRAVWPMAMMKPLKRDQRKV